MAEDEAIFDPTMKKKKKKKKTPFEFEATQEGGDAAAPEPVQNLEDGDVGKPAAEEKKEEETSVKADLDTDDLDLDNFSKMKKKKKKKARFDMDSLAETLPDGDAPNEESTQDANDGSSAPPPSDDVDLDLEGDAELFTKNMKKKKKKKRVTIEDSLENGQVENQKDEDVDAQIKAGIPWAGTERDYTYEELLTRVFDIMKAKNPDMVGDKKRFVMKPPQVVRVGTKKSSFVNFSDICRMLHRQPEHLLAFLLAELGTSGSIDGQNMLIIKGRFQQKQIENVLRRYIKEYVTCHTCRSSETILHKENRLFFLQCESCQSRCSVASIKSGFQAVTSKRAQMRAKAN